LKELAQTHERNVAAERGGGMRRAPELGRKREDALVPKLGGRPRLLFEKRGRDTVDACVHLQPIARGPRVEQLQREKGIAAAARGRAPCRRALEGKRRLQELLGLVGVERTKLDDAPAVREAQR